jgi:hypothetical protein
MSGSNSEVQKKTSFKEGGIGSFKERLKTLIEKKGSVYKASAAWGIPASTLNNYLHKGTEPALKVVLKISNIEGVGLIWLITGSHEDDNKPDVTDRDPLQNAWQMIYQSLDQHQIEGLIKVIHTEGVNGILEMANNDINKRLRELPEEEKERLMRLHEAKKGASETSVDADIAPPADKAG